MDKKTTVAAALSLDALSVLDARASFDLAAGAGYRAVAFGTQHAELNPEKLGESGRRHLKAILSTKGLGVESLRAAVPRGGLAEAATIDQTLDHVRKAMVLARELGVGTVSLNVGALGEGGEARVSEGTMVAALRDLAQQADASGLTLAVGADQAVLLAKILKQVDFEGAKVHLDGARAVGAGEDVLQAAELVAGQVGQFTASDAVRAGRFVRAALLGEGQLPIAELMALLQEHGFRGPVVVDVRDLPDAAAGARNAAAVLARLMKR